MRRVVFVTVILLGLAGVAVGCTRAPDGLALDPAQPTDRAQIYPAMLARFVAHHGEGVGSGTGIPSWRNGCASADVLVTLGPVPATVATATDRLEVGSHGFTACLGFVGTTCTVQRRPGGWVTIEPETITMSIS